MLQKLLMKIPMMLTLVNWKNSMRYPWLLILLFICQLAIAQLQQPDACVQNIETAQQQYDDGRIQDIQGLL